MKRLKLLALLVAGCGGSAEERATADPLPAEFPFEYVSLSASGSARVAGSDTLEVTIELSPADGGGLSQGGLYPVQYGIGYHFPLEGSIRVTLTDCEERDMGFVIGSCAATLWDFELRVPADLRYPDPFTDESTLSLAEPVGGTAASFIGSSYEAVFEPTEVVLSTKSGTSSSRYAAELSALFDDEAVNVQGTLSK